MSNPSSRLVMLFRGLSVMAGGCLIGYALTVLAGYFMPVLLLGVFLVLLNILTNQPALIASGCAAISGGAVALVDSGLLTISETAIAAIVTLLVTDQVMKKI